MNDLRTLGDGDEITIDTEPLSGLTFEVYDVTTESIGITEIVAVTVVRGPDRYAIEWATHSDTANVVSLDSDYEWEIEKWDVTQA